MPTESNFRISQSMALASPDRRFFSLAVPALRAVPNFQFWLALGLAAAISGVIVG
jgi:hypothetical protein